MATPEWSDARLVAVVRGEVQGVGFRFFVLRQAVGLGLRGSVYNRRDGSVEVVAEGARPQLERLLGALRRGPSGARVDDIEQAWGPPELTFSGFVIRH